MTLVHPLQKFHILHFLIFSNLFVVWSLAVRTLQKYNLLLFKPLSHTNSTQIMIFLATSFATIQKILLQLSLPYFRNLTHFRFFFVQLSAFGFVYSSFCFSQRFFTNWYRNCFWEGDFVIADEWKSVKNLKNRSLLSNVKFQMLFIDKLEKHPRLRPN